MSSHIPVLLRLGALGALAVGALGLAGTPAADAAPAPTIREIEVRPGGLHATALVYTPEPTAISYTVTPVVAVVGPVTPGGSRLPLASIANPQTLATISDGTPPPLVSYTEKHDFRLNNLKSNTAYDLTVVVTDRAGLTATATRRFSTLKQRVKVTLDKIVVHEDGDWLSDGDPTWYWDVDWFGGKVKDCFPSTSGRCKEGTFGSGTILPVTASRQKFAFIFAEENFQPIPQPNPQPGHEDFTTMPRNFRLTARVHEADGVPIALDPTVYDREDWQAPQGVESATRLATLTAENGGLKSTLYFTFELFYDNATYAPNDGRVHSTSK